ncbi:MAG: transposase [Arcobacteraceae bacterium]
MNKCIFCHGKHLYILSNGYIKCASCKKKFSLKKQQTQEKIIAAFCNNINAYQCHIQLGLNYVTIHKKYAQLREFIVQYLDTLHKQQKSNSKEYDEYLYLKNKNIYKAQNFLTFAYENKIYNLMLPSLQKFRTYYESNKELSKFLFLNKIAKLQSKSSRINEFWDFLELFLKKFKGVDANNFIYYLKEAEFKFNHSFEEQKKILINCLN